MKEYFVYLCLIPCLMYHQTESMELVKKKPISVYKKKPIKKEILQLETETNEENVTLLPSLILRPKTSHTGIALPQNQAPIIQTSEDKKTYDNLKIAVKNPEPRSVRVLANIANSPGRYKKLAEIILEMLGDEGNPSATDALYRLGIWLRPNVVPPSLNVVYRSSDEPVCHSLAEYMRKKTSIGNYNLQKKREYHESLLRNDKSFAKSAAEFDEDLAAGVDVRYAKVYFAPDIILDAEQVAKKIKYPVSYEYIGDLRDFKFYAVEFAPSWSGWKIHISPRISSAEKVMKVVLPYLIENNIVYKCICDLDAVRTLYMRGKHHSDTTFSQRGKFITIYPKNDDEARRIVDGLEPILKVAGLTREDFVFVHGDFQLGDTGGFYTRLTADTGYDSTRGRVAISKRAIWYHLGDLDEAAAATYCHPFTQDLKNRGVVMPKNVLKIMETLEKDTDSTDIDQLLIDAGIKNDDPLDHSIKIRK